MTSQALRVLQVEDSDDDAELVQRELTKSGFALDYRRVQTTEDLEAALRDPPEVILCDYTMPRLDAPTALEVVRRSGVDVPFIVVSGTIGEDTAVEMMRAGAHDYLLKGNLRRLGAAVSRAVAEAKGRAERRQHGEARREAEESFRLIIECSPDLIVVHRDGRILYANPRTVERLGYETPDALVGQSLDSIVMDRHGNPTRAQASVDRAALATADQSWRRRDGSAISVEVVRGGVLFEGGPAVVFMGRDLTERDKMAAAMMEMDRMAAIGILAAGVGHEINNPLAYVLANLEFVTVEMEEILRELAPEARNRLESRIIDLRQALADTNHGASRVRDIVQDLRTFSRGDDEKVSLVDVRQVLDSSVRMAAVQIRQRATLERDYRDIAPVLANESRLGQVFLNLVVNAAQAVPEGTPSANRIELVTREEDGFVVIEVADSGTGIAPDVLPRIFDPFFTTKGSGQGTGLGLSICRRIIMALGGDIAVESRIGRGARFTVRIPRAVTDSDRPRSMPPTSAPTSKRARVLCVDDEPALGLALRRVLGDIHDVVVLTSAKDARDRVAAGERFDLVLCDLMMPGMSGMDLHKELERLAPDLARRVLFLTGGAFTGRARDFLERVPNPRLEKPVGIDDLRATIEQMLTDPQVEAAPS